MAMPNLDRFFGKNIFLKLYKYWTMFAEVVNICRETNFQSWALSVFLNFSNNKKWFFPFFIKLIWLGVGFLNRNGAEIGY